MIYRESISRPAGWIRDVYDFYMRDDGGKKQAVLSSTSSHRIGDVGI